jgi:hypothetical protein
MLYFGCWWDVLCGSWLDDLVAECFKTTPSLRIGSMEILDGVFFVYTPLTEPLLSILIE